MNPNKMLHFENLCGEWHKNAALAEHCNSHVSIGTFSCIKKACHALFYKLLCDIQYTHSGPINFMSADLLITLIRPPDQSA